MTGTHRSFLFIIDPVLWFPSHAVPGDRIPSHTVPGYTVPGHAIPSHAVPSHAAPHDGIRSCPQQLAGSQTSICTSCVLSMDSLVDIQISSAISPGKWMSSGYQAVFHLIRCQSGSRLEATGLRLRRQLPQPWKCLTCGSNLLHCHRRPRWQGDR